MNADMTLEMSVQEFELDGDIIEIRIKREKAELEKRRGILLGMRRGGTSNIASNMSVARVAGVNHLKPWAN